MGAGLRYHGEKVGLYACSGKVNMAKKKLDTTKARAYWEMGLSDEMIASRCEVKVYAVQDWRVKNNLCPNRGNAVTKEEAVTMLPKIGEEVRRVPGFLKMEGKAEPAPWEATVIAVNEKRLTYTVRFKCGLTETYKAI